MKSPATLVMTTVEMTQNNTPNPQTANRHEALLQIQRTDPFCKCTSRCLSNDKAPQQKAVLFMHIKGLLYKHVMYTNQKFMALIIPKAWKYAVLLEAYGKLGHQGVTHTFCLIY